MNHCKDLTGMQFGRWHVIRKSEVKISGKPAWECVCECGTRKIISGGTLRAGNSKSCGCYRRDLAREQHSTHGLSRDGNGKHTRIFRIWTGIKDRCTNKNSKYWDRYGGAGIGICDEWKNSFESFYKWAMENGYDDTLSVDRIDNSKGYSPDNCRLTTMYVQENNRTNNVLFLVNEEIMTLAQLSRMTGLSRHMAEKKYKEAKYNGNN